MLNEAFAKIPDGTNLILHSDQGWQYQHKQYQRMLREKGVRQMCIRDRVKVDPGEGPDQLDLLVVGPLKGLALGHAGGEDLGR